MLMPRGGHSARKLAGRERRNACWARAPGLARQGLNSRERTLLAWVRSPGLRSMKRRLKLAMRARLAIIGGGCASIRRRPPQPCCDPSYDSSTTDSDPRLVLARSRRDNCSGYLPRSVLLTSKNPYGVDRLSCFFAVRKSGCDAHLPPFIGLLAQDTPFFPVLLIRERGHPGALLFLLFQEFSDRCGA